MEVHRDATKEIYNNDFRNQNHLIYLETNSRLLHYDWSVLGRVVLTAHTTYITAAHSAPVLRDTFHKQYHNRHVLEKDLKKIATELGTKGNKETKQLNNRLCKFASCTTEMFHVVSEKNTTILLFTKYI